MAVTRSEKNIAHKPYMEDTYSLVLTRDGIDTNVAMVNQRWLIDSLTLRARFMARDVRNAIQDGGLNEDGYAIDSLLWLEAIEDAQEAMAWLIGNLPIHKEISFTLQYANHGPMVWTIGRVESAA